MIDVQDMHRQAMERADQAAAAQKTGDFDEARRLCREACSLESAAAQALIDKLDVEPTRSVLFRSAASLAIEAQQFAHAAYLVACGLEGSPPEEIREELRNLLRSLRHEVERDPLSDQELGGGDRVRRYLASCAMLRSAADRVRVALTDASLMGPQLSGPLVQEVLASIEDSLRAFSGDTSLGIDLFGVGGTDVSEWVPLSGLEPLSDWSQFAKHFVLEHDATLLRGNPIAGQIDELAREGVLSEEYLASAQRVGIHALSANPVRAIDEKHGDRPAFVLLALASQKTAFADELACQILSETVSLLEIVVQTGWRDRRFELRSLRAPQEDS
ncbi:MAG: hypothetical protein ABIK89_22165 [Planctomycetota bacterium]